MCMCMWYHRLCNVKYHYPNKQRWWYSLMEGIAPKEHRLPLLIHVQAIASDCIIFQDFLKLFRLSTIITFWLANQMATCIRNGSWCPFGARHFIRDRIESLCWCLQSGVKVGMRIVLCTIKVHESRFPLLPRTWLCVENCRRNNQWKLYAYNTVHSGDRHLCYWEN